MQETSESGEQNVSVAKGFIILKTEKKQGSSKNFRSFLQCMLILQFKL